MTNEWKRNREVPDRLTMMVPGLDRRDAHFLAEEAVAVCQRLMPRLSGVSSRRLVPVSSEGWFGIKWLDDYVWYQEHGISPFTMRSLEGKTIPMWVNDPTGEVARKNPKAQKRVVADGRKQVLIFRKAAPIGSRKTVIRDGVEVDVPRSYPGAPGRISRRQPVGRVMGSRRVGGQIAQGNVGVRWRHPGLPRKGFVRQALVITAEYHNYPVGPVRDNLGRYG